ncbi:MAG: glycosyltransferase family 1 protein [Chloroflexi bacterium]|nr:glycosyltransferase family 1 protein [Chloroflexota bacterium]
MKGVFSLRIGIDIRDLAIARTGGRTVLEELCQALPQVAPHHEFVFLEPTYKLRQKPAWIAKAFGHFSYFIWKEVHLPWLAWRAKCDVLFCTDYVAPFWATCPTIVAFFDANFWANPQQYNRLWRRLMDWFAVPAAQRAGAVITISPFAKQEILKYLPIPESKIHVTNCAPKTATIQSPLSVSAVQAILEKYNLHPETKFLLHVGVLEKRKNLPRLIRALPQISFPYHLVLVGQSAPKADMDDTPDVKHQIEILGLSQRVHLLGYVPDQDLQAFYQAADLFVFPSLREGFGIPILEAFGNKLPVAAARAAAIPHVAGDAALLFDPLDIHDIAQTIQQALQPDQQMLLIQRGSERLKQYSWTKTAQQLILLFEQLVSSTQIHHA